MEVRIKDGYLYIKASFKELANNLENIKRTVFNRKQKNAAIKGFFYGSTISINDLLSSKFPLNGKLHGIYLIEGKDLAVYTHKNWQKSLDKNNIMQILTNQIESPDALKQHIYKIHYIGYGGGEGKALVLFKKDKPMVLRFQREYNKGDMRYEDSN